LNAAILGRVCRRIRGRFKAQNDGRVRVERTIRNGGRSEEALSALPIPKKKEIADLEVLGELWRGNHNKSVL